MFSIVKIIEPPKGFFERRKIKKGLIAPKIYYSRFNGATVRIVCTVYEGNPFFEEQIQKIVGNDETVFPKNINGGKIRTPDCTELLRRCAVDRFKEIVKNASKEHKITIGLSDRNARCQGVAAELIPFATVRVFTLRPEEYDGCCAYTFEKYGESPEISESNYLLPDTDFCLAPYGLDGMKITDERTVLYSQRKKDGGIFFSERDFVCPVDIMTLAGSDYNRIELASAIFNEKESNR